MTKTETPATLTAALAKLQTVMEQPSKNAVNPHFKNKYADLAACMDAVRPHLAELGLAVTQTTRILDNGMTVLDTTLRHVSAEVITGTYPINPTQNTPQGYGSAMTYARRYALCALLGIVADDDDDGQAASAPAKPKAPTAAEKARYAATSYIARIHEAKTAEAANAVLDEVDNTGNLKKYFPELYAEVKQEHKAHVEYLDRKGV